MCPSVKVHKIGCEVKDGLRKVPASERTPGFMYVTTGRFHLLLAR